MSQYFKGDDVEKQFEAAVAPVLNVLSMQLDLFFEGAYDAMPLGDVLHEGVVSPLSNAIKLEIFRASFNTIYDAFVVSGSFESYLTVFRKIFGDTVEVEFVVPAPGKLQINIIAEELEESFFVARRIVNDAYVFDNVIYEDDDGTGQIIFQSVKGFHSQYELEQMLFEMVPAGVFTEISLTFGA